MYRNNVLNIKVNVTSETRVQDKIIYKKDLLKLQKNIAKYYKVKPQINVLFKDEYSTELRQTITSNTEYSETSIYIRIITLSDDRTELRIYDFEIASGYINLYSRKVATQVVE